VALEEEQLRWIDFGEAELGKVKEVEARTELEDMARGQRFEAVLKQAVARWEMDSDWERASE